jgi:GTP-binding protein
MQAPKYAQPGQPAREIELLLELKVIADVGLVGFPNVGKSTILSVASNAKPEIANYHFTTLSPILGVVDLPDAQGFVMADIPGLIEGASDGAGLGYEFLAHIERCKLLVHVVDAAGSEDRDPLQDIETINHELAAYNIDLSQKKQIIAANKVDLIPEGEDPVQKIRDKYEPLGIRVFPLSAATGQGIREMLYYISGELAKMPPEMRIYHQEFDPEEELSLRSDAFTAGYDQKKGEFFVEGPKVERMLGYTNLDTEKGFLFFQKFMKDNGVIEELKKQGLQEGDTVRVYGHAFEYYDESRPEEPGSDTEE